MKARKTHEVTEPDEEAAPRRSAEVIDLMAALRKSLDSKAGRPQRRPASRAQATRARRSQPLERRRRRA